MSTNAPARPHSRRTALTGLAVGLAVPALAGETKVGCTPDPVFALIEAEKAATAMFEAALDNLEAADLAFEASGFDRKPRVQTGTMMWIVDRELNPLPMDQWREEPVYLYSREDIARAPDPTTRTGALARFEADEAAIAEARERCGVNEANRREHETSDAQRAAEQAVYEATPTTAAGLLAMLDLFDEREINMHMLPEPANEFLAGIFAAVRSIMREA